MTHFAYLDPGSGTLLVQALLGGAAGIAVLVKTKGKRLFKRNTAEEPEQRADSTDSDETTTSNPHSS